jgi:hypothetical protein
MLLTKVKNSSMKNDLIGVGQRSYETDGRGCCSVYPQDVSALVACGFTVIGQVDKKKKAVVRLPESKEEFMDLAMATGLTADDLRAMADLLDPPAPVEVEETLPVMRYIAPPPPEQMITVPPDEPEAEAETTVKPEAGPVEEIAALPKLAGADEGDSDSDEEEEISVSLASTKRQLLDVAIKLGLNVKPAMRKGQIYDAIMQTQG